MVIWLPAQKLKRVFNIDVTVCVMCKNNNVKIIACTTEAATIQKILTHLDKTGSLISANTGRASQLNTSTQIVPNHDYVIQRNFDFGA